MIKVVAIIFLVTMVLAAVFLNRRPGLISPTNPLPTVNVLPTSTPLPTPTLQTPPISKALESSYHVFQSFNNCGPAALSMALSYYGISKTQQELGQLLRPYQVPGGDNDDKSVTLEELAALSSEYGFIPFHRPNGNIELIKLFITYDLPVITRTWLKVNDDIGHYRVIKGFNEETKTLIQDDSLQGENLSYSYSEFDQIWQKFNYEYLVLAPADKRQLVEAILKDEVDSQKSWEKAVQRARQQLAVNPDDYTARFNLSVALYNSGDYQASVNEFEKVEARLPFRTLWYQIEPIEAYFKLGNYQRVLSLTEKILNNHNRAFSELYFLRGQVYQQQDNLQAAKAEYEKAVFYNQNFSSRIPSL